MTATRLVAVLALAATSLAAQQPQGCAWQLDSVGGVGQHFDLGGGRVHQHAGGGVWASCQGQETRMYADSVAWYSERNRVDFVGRVNFRDSVVTLDADRASYFLRDERLEAYGGARLVNRESGSELQGPQLVYWRAVPGTRDTAELYAAERPTVRYRSAGDTAGVEPYVIVAQRVRMRGESATWAGGDVTVERSDFSAAADSAALQLDGGTGYFFGRARIKGSGASSYTLDGRRVEFRMEQRKLSWVQAQEQARAASAEWNLTADTVEFAVADGLIEHGTAWGDSSRPDAASESYSMTADSLAIDTPNQQLQEIRGFGRARATARADSAITEPDWVAGDSLVARFDTIAGGGGKRILQSLEAQGKAQAYYRVYEEDGRTLAGINYSRGARILAQFREDGIQRVHVIGGSDGVYLEPVLRRPPSP